MKSLHNLIYYTIKTYCSTDDTSKRIPGSFIEPIEEIVKPIFNHVMSGTVVEPTWKGDKYGLLSSNVLETNNAYSKQRSTRKISLQIIQIRLRLNI